MLKLSILFTLFSIKDVLEIVKIGKILTIAGIVIIIMGTIFHLQGQSVVGPQSSFMYSNQEWITYGLEILFVGIIILAVSIILSKTSS